MATVKELVEVRLNKAVSPGAREEFPSGRPSARASGEILGKLYDTLMEALSDLGIWNAEVHEGRVEVLEFSEFCIALAERDEAFARLGLEADDRVRVIVLRSLEEGG